MVTQSVMKAAIVERSGAPFILKQVARPEPPAGQVLVRVGASAVNPLDTKIRAGVAAHAKQPLPAILGIDVAGTVASVGEGVTSFRPGDEVYGMTGGVGGVQGSLAEYTLADADLLAPKPGNLSMREAAALPLIFITAWEGLVDRANLRAGQTVLIHGGAGGVGHVAVQIAAALGATVFSTASRKNFEIVSGFGATPIDYHSVPVDEYVARYTDGSGFDVVYDTAGGAVLDSSFEAVGRYGHVVSCLGWGTHKLAPLSFRGATYSGVFTLLPILSGVGRARHGEIMREATRLVESGKLRPRVDERRFSLASVQDAHEILEKGLAEGKLVVDVG